MTTSDKSPFSWASVDLAKSTAEAFSKECRDSPRYRCSGTAEIAEPGSAVKHSGQLRDLSLTGCRILSTSLAGLAVSAPVEVLLDIDGLKLRLPARVVRIGKQEGTALRFGHLSPRNADLIHQVSKEVAARAKESAKKDAKAAGTKAK